MVVLFFAIAAAYGISGGPQYPGSINVVGTYAGVLTPKASPCPSTSPEPSPACVPTVASCAANSLGVFSIAAPENGLASGTFVMFAQGRVFSGTIQGVADPGTAKLRGVLKAKYDFTVTFTPTPCPEVSPAVSCTPSSRSQQVTALANGNLKAQISTSAASSTSGDRISGTATIDISNGTVNEDTFQQNVDCAMFLKVKGFKQSNSTTNIGTGSG